MTMNTTSTIVWELPFLPDFLRDHTLAATEPAGRLREVVGRWVLLLGSLWRWSDRQTFALRFAAADGRIRVHFLAAGAAGDEPVLVREVKTLLRSHGLVARRTSGASAPMPVPLARTEVSQLTTTQLWRLPPRIQQERA